MVVFSLTLVRHGETIANKDGIIQGHQDVALSETGVTQARLVAFRLRNEKFTHIFASDLSRAARTAQIIAEASTECHCSVIQKDPRLRERKFGIYEGKTFTELFAAAKESNKKWSDFTPEGAETYDEVRFRARDFFREVCEKMATSNLSSENTYIPIPVKNIQSIDVDLKTNRIGFSTATADVASDGNKTDKGATTVQASSGHPQSTEEAIAAKRPRTEEPQLHRLSLDGERPSTDADCAFSEVQGAGATTMARSNSSSSSGCSSLHDSVECPEADVDLPTPTEEERDTDSSDVGISRAKQGPTTSACPSKTVGSNDEGPQEQHQSTEKKWCSFAGHSAINWLWDGLQPWVKDTDPSVISGSPVDPSGHTCPNVSLSPLLEHRLTSISSVSSGRNSSFDDADIVPSVAGEVLVVTHGGLIKELVTHFIEDLNCKVPGGKGHALRVCPNTGVSRFMVTLSETDLQPAVTCLLINDKEHLKTWQEPLPNQYPAV